MIMLPRQRQWRSQLLTQLLPLVGQPFAWGVTDCASITRRALAAMFGHDVTQLPAWNSPRELLEVRERHGAPADILRGLGAQERALTFLRVGDVVVSTEPEEEDREALYVCLHGSRCITGTRHGVTLTRPERGTVYSLWEVPAHG